MSPRITRLFVLWSDPQDGTRYVIGDLSREVDGFKFAYGRELDRALARGLKLLPEFPDRSKSYGERHLFSTFAQRIPSPARPDFSQMMDSWGVRVELRDDPMEILARSGGIQATDRLELAEFRDDLDPLTQPLLFRVAGPKHHDGTPQLCAGEHVVLLREKANPHDEYATLVLKKAGRPIGYVPRQYSKMISQHLDTGHALETVAVQRLVVPPDRGRWLISARRTR